jgi:hypothetical protein
VYAAHERRRGGSDTALAAAQQRTAFSGGTYSITRKTAGGFVLHAAWELQAVSRHPSG